VRLLGSRDLQATREKLRLLKDRYEKIRFQQSGDQHVRELTLRSFKRLINQLTEEIARYEAHAGGGVK
jgi:hypothetical protein